MVLSAQHGSRSLSGLSQSALSRSCSTASTARPTVPAGYSDPAAAGGHGPAGVGIGTPAPAAAWSSDAAAATDGSLKSSPTPMSATPVSRKATADSASDAASFTSALSHFNLQGLHEASPSATGSMSTPREAGSDPATHGSALAATPSGATQAGGPSTPEQAAPDSLPLFERSCPGSHAKPFEAATPSHDSCVFSHAVFVDHQTPSPRISESGSALGLPDSITGPISTATSMSRPSIPALGDMVLSASTTATGLTGGGMSCALGDSPRAAASTAGAAQQQQGGTASKQQHAGWALTLTDGVSVPLLLQEKAALEREVRRCACTPLVFFKRLIHPRVSE